MCLQRGRAVVASLAAVMLLAGCLGGDPDVAITGRPTSTSSSTTAPVGKQVVTAPPKPIVLPAPGTVAVRAPSGVLATWLGMDGDAIVVRTPCGKETTLTSFELVEPVDVVVDAGHGGLDPGAVSSTGVTEADLNLDIALRVRELLRAKGISVELTRTGDYFRTIADRAELAAAVRPRAFVSIHHNGGSHPPADLGPGTEAYHERRDEESRRLAGLLWEDVVEGLSTFDIDWVATRYRGALWRADRDGDDFYGLLRRAETMPAVILESAFMTGAAEAELIRTDEFRAVEAEAIARGIERFLHTSEPGAGYIDGFTLGGSARTFDMRSCEDPPLQ